MFAWVASVAAQTTPEGIGTSANQTTIWVTSIVGFLSLLATQLFAIWRDNQARKAARQQREWDLEDRRAAREEAKEEMRRQAEIVRREQIATATDLAKVHQLNSRRIVEEIAKNTQLTHEVKAQAEAAYTAANNFTQRLEEARADFVRKGTQIDHIEATADDIDSKVTELKEGS